jgi:MFS family permease
MVRIAYAISFLDMLGYGFLSPITYSLLNKDVIGATGFGALQSVSNAAALLAGASLGRLSDTRGRKPAIVVSAGLSLFGYLLYVAGRVAADAAPLAACVLPCVAQVLTTVGRAGLIAPLNALLTDGQSDEEGRRLLGRLVGTFGLGYAIGSGSGGYLSQYDHALLLALACLVAAAVLACSLLLPNSTPSSKPSSKPSSNPSSTPALAANGGGRAHAVSGDSGGAGGGGGGGSGGGGWLSATRTALSDRATVLLLVLQLLRNVSFHVYSGTSKIYFCEHLGYSQARRSYIV